MILDYDQAADVLYITFATSKVSARYLETPTGQILRVNARTGRVLSCTIPMFSRRAKQGDLEIREVGVVISNRDLRALLEH